MKACSRVFGIISASFVFSMVITGAPPAVAQLTNFQRLHSFGFTNRVGTTPRAAVIAGRDGFLYGTTAMGGYGVIYKLRPNGNDYSVLHRFQGTDGFECEADLLEASEGGVLYGTAKYGGQFSGGTLFKINTDGSGFQLLHHFGATGGGDGRLPWSEVIEGSNGKLYGSTYSGGTNLGTVYVINKDGSGYQTLRQFPSGGSEGVNLGGRVIEASDGALYGAAAWQGGGPSASYGTLFKINKDGSNFQVFKRFVGPPTEPANVYAGLIQGRDGALYGMSLNGGVSNRGTIFRIDLDGQNLVVLHNLTGGLEPGGPLDGLLQAQDGALYGTGFYGGAYGRGGIFRINTDGSSFTVLHNFQRGSDQYYTSCKLVQAPSGELFSTRERGGLGDLGVVYGLEANGANYRVLWEFSSSGGDTRSPIAPLVEGPEGVLYGAGSTGALDGTAGAVFRINRNGTDYTLVRRFGFTAEDGAGLAGGVIIGRDGKLYGAAEHGGTNGAGILYKLNRDGTGYEILHHFAFRNYAESPRAPLLHASDGFLYGTTRYNTGGTIFKIRTNGTGFEVIRYLTPSTDGADLQSALIESSDGFLYGTAPIAGASGGGTVYRIGRDGSNFMVLRHFMLNTFGEAYTVLPGLLEASDHVLYGSTPYGGTGRGTVFKINKDGSGYTVLRHFTELGGMPSPLAGVIEGRDGALYGILYAGGFMNHGGVFKLNKDGTGYMVLHEFSDADGYGGTGALLNARDGALYGIANIGGDVGLGTVFRLGHVLGLVKQGSSMKVHLTGVPGYNYTVLRSADLRDWRVLNTATIPASGRVEMLDVAPPAGAGFYRAAPP